MYVFQEVSMKCTPLVLVCALALSLVGFARPLSAGQAATSGTQESKSKEGKASGKVTKVGADSFTLDEMGKEMMISVDKSTYVQEKGGSTKMRALEREGKPSTLDQFLHVGDEVQVQYKEMDGKMIAKNIRVTKKAT
jgi:hypothetical protein